MMKINLSQFPTLEAKLLFKKGLHLHVHCVTRGQAEYMYSSSIEVKLYTSTT